MSDGDRLMREYAGATIGQKNAAALAMRIDGLINIARSEERHRCFDIARDALCKILKPDEEQP